MRVIGNNPAADNAEITAVASGTLPSGKTVIVNADGTVSVVVEISPSESLGSDVTFSAATTTWTASAFDSTNNKVVVAYRGGSSNYASARVGTVDSSDNSISWGTEVTFLSSAAQYMSACFDSANGKIVIAYQHNADSNKAKAIVGTVSGTDISFGDAVELTSGETKYINIAYDTSASKVVVAYWTSGTNVGKARVGTVSGTGISFGTEASTVAGIVHGAVVYHAAAARIVVAGKIDGNTANSAVGVVSGTNISFGSATAYGTSNAQKNANTLGYDSASEKVVVFYKDEGANGDGKASVGTVDASDNSIAFATAVTVTTDTVDKTSVQGFSTAGKIIFVYSDTDNTKGDLKVGTISGTTLSVGSELNVRNGGHVQFWTLCEDTTSDRILIAHEASGGNSHGISNVYNPAYTSTNITAENFIGFSPGSVGIESRTQAVGSETVFEAASSTQFGSTFDTSNNKVVFSYTDAGNSSKGTAIVGTISDTSISFGSAVEFEQGATESHTATFDTNSNKVVLAYRDRGNSDYGTAIVGTVSGTNISFGSAVAFVSSNSDYIRIVFDSNSNKVVISYVDLGDSNKGKAIVGTVSGTNISFGSATEFESGSTQLFANPAFDSLNNKIVIPYKDLGNSNYGTAVVGTVSGTSISFGTPVVFAQGETRDIGIDFDTTNNKVVIAYKNESGSNYGTSIVGTVSGTSISFGTAVVYQSSDSRNNNVTFDPSAQTSTITYQNQTSSEVGQFVVGTISGTSISFTSATTFTGSNSAFFLSTTLDSNSNRLATAFYDQSNSNYGTSVILKTGFTTITRDEVASGSKATIDIGSAISTNQLSLTAGQQYFVQTDGTLGLTAADPSVIAGTAISATEIIVKG